MGARVVPALTPLELNPVPVAVTLETVTFEFPVFVSVAVKELLPATFTFPKLRLVGFAPSRKLAATPVPLRGMAIGELGALLAKDTLPVMLVALAGEKAKLKFALCPGLRAKGRAKPLTVKPLPETAA